VVYVSELSERSSLSEALCLRFLDGWGAGVGEVLASSSEAPAGRCWVVTWAENSGEREAWEVGMDGRAEVTGMGE
jgi:hypothetical protein